MSKKRDKQTWKFIIDSIPYPIELLKLLPGLKKKGKEWIEGGRDPEDAFGQVCSIILMFRLTDDVRFKLAQSFVANPSSYESGHSENDRDNGIRAMHQAFNVSVFGFEKKNWINDSIALLKLLPGIKGTGKEWIRNGRDEKDEFGATCSILLIARRENSFAPRKELAKKRFKLSEHKRFLLPQAFVANKAAYMSGYTGTQKDAAVLEVMRQYNLAAYGFSKKKYVIYPFRLLKLIPGLKKKGKEWVEGGRDPADEFGAVCSIILIDCYKKGEKKEEKNVKRESDEERKRREKEEKEKEKKKEKKEKTRKGK